MDNFGLIEKLQDYCDSNDYHFIYGNDAFANALIDNNIQNYRYILIADFSCPITMENSVITEIRYTGIMSFGENPQFLVSGSKSPLDETPQQKYDLRLKTLSSMLMTVIGDIMCENELSVEGIDLKYDMNKFDLAADFVVCSLTLIQ